MSQSKNGRTIIIIEVCKAYVCLLLELHTALGVGQSSMVKRDNSSLPMPHAQLPMPSQVRTASMTGSCVHEDID